MVPHDAERWLSGPSPSACWAPASRGLSAAHHLDAPYVVHERQPGPGGHVVTVEEDGFRFDRTGHLLHLRRPDVREWVTELLGDQLLEVERNSRVFSHGRYTRYPYQANTYGLPPEIAFECLRTFLEAAEVMDTVPEPATFEEFCLKHFGTGFSEHFMIPYNGKLWGVHPREITADWCTRFVPLPDRDDVLAGAVGLNDRELGYNAVFSYPRLGIGQLSSALAEGVADHVQYSSAPTAVDWRRRCLRFGDEEVPFEVLISTVPLDRLLDLMVDLPEDVAAARGKLRCTSLQYLDVALDVPCGVDLHWAYVPEPRFPFYRVGCYSNFSADMAPEGCSNLYVELASRDVQDLDALLPEVAAGLVEMGIISSPSDIRFARLRRLEHAYVLYDHGYAESLDRIRPFLDRNGIISTGRYGGWNYSSMEDALVFGIDAARGAEKQLS